MSVTAVTGPLPRDQSSLASMDTAAAPATENAARLKYAEAEYWHDAAKLYPLLAETELQAMANNIAEVGLLNPVVLYEGKVLDGRNRVLACQRAGVTPTFIDWQPNALSPVTWVLIQNSQRRHLTPSQKAFVALEAEKLLTKEAKQRQRMGKQKVADPNAKGQARDKAAELVGVNRQYVSDAKRLEKIAPALAEEVKRGQKTLPQAKDEAKKLRDLTTAEEETDVNVLAAELARRISRALSIEDTKAIAASRRRLNPPIRKNLLRELRSLLRSARRFEKELSK